MFKFIFRFTLLLLVGCFGLYSYGCYNANQARLLREHKNNQLLAADQNIEEQHWPSSSVKPQIVAYPPPLKQREQAPKPLLNFDKIARVYSKTTEEGLKKFQNSTDDISSNINLGWQSLVSDLTNLKSDYNYLQEKFQTSLHAIDLLHKSLKQAKQQIDEQNKEIAQMKKQMYLSTKQAAELKQKAQMENLQTEYVAIPHRPQSVPRGNMDYIIVNYNQ